MRASLVICLAAIVAAAPAVRTRAKPKASVSAPAPVRDPPTGTCAIVPVGDDELRGALARALGPRAATAAERADAQLWLLEAFDPSKPSELPLSEARSYLPAPAARAASILAEHIRARSGCAAGEELALACPEHARLVGFELAVIAESARRGTRAPTRALCNATFISLPILDRYRNTPGGMLLSVQTAIRHARELARPFGLEPEHVLSFPVNTLPGQLFGGSFFELLYGGSFFELLYGYYHATPCASEVERACGVSLHDRERVFELNRTRGAHAVATRKELAALARMPRPRIVRLPSWRISIADNLEKDIHSVAELRALAVEYERMRTLLPIDTPYVAEEGGRRIVNVAVHVRSGSGSKSAPEWAFIPMLELLTHTIANATAHAAANATACAPHIHVLHEHEDGMCCNRSVAWAARQTLPGLRLVAQIGRHRAALWHALWSADVLVTSKSLMGQTIGALSPRVQLFIDAHDTHAGRPTGWSTRVAWSPCNASSAAKHQKCDPANVKPAAEGLVVRGPDGELVGGPDAAVAVVRHTIAALCARASPMALATS